MKTPEWLKPGLYGAACGAAALAGIGFSWGGWVTGGTARTMAADQKGGSRSAIHSLPSALPRSRPSRPGTGTISS